MGRGTSSPTKTQTEPDLVQNIKSHTKPHTQKAHHQT